MTYEQPDPNQPTDCLPLAELVEKLASDAARGEFDKSAKGTLEEVANGADKALQDYSRDTDHKEHVIRWEKQRDKIIDLGKRLTNCFPNWVDILKDHICDKVIKPIRDTRQLLYYPPSAKCPPSDAPPSCECGPKIGFCETTLVKKDYCLEQAKAQLDAWKDITGWIKKRLDDNQALYDEICKLDKCEDYAVALYIYFFELLPAHRGLDPCIQPPPTTFEEECCHGRLLPDCELIGFPWLIPPEDYLAKLDEVACAWLDAGRKQAEAQAAFDGIEVLKNKLKEDDTPASRRAKATEELKNLKCADDDDNDDGGDQYPDPTPDCGPGPDQYQKPEPDSYPEPEPDPYPKPEPDPYPKPEPDPYPRPDSNNPQTS